MAGKYTVHDPETCTVCKGHAASRARYAQWRREDKWVGWVLALTMVIPLISFVALIAIITVAIWAIRHVF